MLPDPPAIHECRPAPGPARDPRIEYVSRVAVPCPRAGGACAVRMRRCGSRHDHEFAQRAATLRGETTAPRCPRHNLQILSKIYSYRIYSTHCRIMYNTGVVSNVINVCCRSLSYQGLSICYGLPPAVVCCACESSAAGCPRPLRVTLNAHRLRVSGHQCGIDGGALGRNLSIHRVRLCTQARDDTGEL